MNQIALLAPFRNHLPWGSGRRRLLLAGMTAALAFAGLSPVMLARPRGPKPVKISGVVTEVNARHISIEGNKGPSLVLRTDRDYTAEVAAGSHVTVTYVSRRGAKVLETLTPPLQNLFVPAYEIRARVHKVIILPRSDVSGSREFFDALSRYLESNLNWYMKPRVMAEEIRARAGASGKSVLDAMDPATGNFDMTAYLAGRRELIREIAKETRVDAVLEANLDEVEADFDAKRRVASWAGVRKSTNAGGGSPLDALIFVPIKGKIPATTLTLTLWNAQARPLWSMRRGFSVLEVQEGFLGKLRRFPLAESLEDRAAVHQWFNGVFGFLKPQSR